MHETREFIYLLVRGGLVSIRHSKVGSNTGAPPPPYCRVPTNPTCILGRQRLDWSVTGTQDSKWSKSEKKTRYLESLRFLYNIKQRLRELLGKNEVGNNFSDHVCALICIAVMCFLINAVFRWSGWEELSGSRLELDFFSLTWSSINSEILRSLALMS